MNYKQYLRKQIQELENQISNAQGEKGVLEKELEKLKLMEFEEDMRNEGSNKSQILLKG
jgi:hypothetical protein